MLSVLVKRDPDADEGAGASASKARELANKGTGTRIQQRS